MLFWYVFFPFIFVVYKDSSRFRFHVFLQSSGNTGAALKLIEKGADIFFVDPRDGWAGAHYAARFGKIKILETMINAGLDVNMRTTGKETLLHKACRTNRTSTVLWLMKVILGFHERLSLDPSHYLPHICLCLSMVILHFSYYHHHHHSHHILINRKEPILNCSTAPAKKLLILPRILNASLCVNILTNICKWPKMVIYPLPVFFPFLSSPSAFPIHKHS